MEKLSINIDLSATLSTNSSNIQGYIFVDDELVSKYTFDQSGNYSFTGEVDLDDGIHKIGFTLNNKSTKDTVVDDTGNIISDTLITLVKLQIDGIDVTELFLKNAKFTNLENTEIPIIRNVGFNGVYAMEFSVPYYEWLLSKV